MDYNSGAVGDGLKALSNLLSGANLDADDDNELDGIGGSSAMTPGSIGPAKKRIAQKPKTEKDNKDIWEEDEVNEDDRGIDDDPRPAPEYEMIYKQAVSSNDMYLQMSGRDPSSQWCEDIIVRIKLPGHKLSDCDLEVTDKYIDLRSPTHRLGLHLPHPCDSKNGTAKFDSSKCELNITLKMNREYDFLRE
eukprot:m.269570 g.269570  ORF g.269570 m.269570 type:complete len:191 (-) comp85279_c0_seq1:229-801(-)